MPETDFTELTACIAAGVKRSRRRVKIFQSIHLSLALACVVLLIASIFLMIAGIELTVGWGLLIGAGIFFLGALALILGLRGMGRDRRLTLERNAALKLAAMQDVRTVGSLIDAVHWILQWTGHRALRPDVWKVLGPLLPRLTQEEARALGRERHGLLANWIYSWDTTLYRKHYLGLGNQPLLGMLYVMTQVGENTIPIGDYPFRTTLPLMPVLEKWIAGNGAGSDPEVQQAAALCRDAILHHTALNRSGEQLLRASAAAPAGSESLLRAAQGVAPAEPQQLLRPTDPE